MAHKNYSKRFVFRSLRLHGQILTVKLRFHEQLIKHSYL